MARNRNQLPVPVPQPQIVYVPDPAMQADLERLTTSQLATRRAQERALYEIWQQRQARIAEHDRKVRSFLWGFGAVIGVVFLGLAVFVGWWLWTSVSLGAFAIPALVLLAAAVSVGGHRCITVVQHWH